MKDIIAPNRSFFDTKRVNEVTFLSKTLAAILFIALPFIGFAIGMVYGGGSLALSLPL